MADLPGDSTIDWKKLLMESKYGKDDEDWNEFLDGLLGPRIVKENNA